MFDQAKAAEFYVVAWCKNWTLQRYLRVVTETEERGGWIGEHEVVDAHAAYPWIPARLGDYICGRLVRSQIADNFPKLSEWLWGRSDDLKRLACAPQIERLRDRNIRKKADTPPRIDKDYARVMATRAMVSKIQKSTQRGAWNVCKG